jgi:hypothetical protein
MARIINDESDLPLDPSTMDHALPVHSLLVPFLRSLQSFPSFFIGLFQFVSGAGSNS